MRGRFLTGALLTVALVASPASAADATYTIDEVAKHATSADCWSAVRGSVYNFTNWIAQHPHGADDILGMCGKDATGAYEAEHIGSATARAALEPFRIGYLSGAVPSPTASASGTAASGSPTAVKPSVKPRKVTCVKGKQVKKFSAKKCPIGWKKR